MDNQNTSYNVQKVAVRSVLILVLMDNQNTYSWELLLDNLES